MKLHSHSFAEKLKFGDKKQVMAYEGTTESGKEFFAYIICNPEQVRILRIDSETGKARRVFEYGEILYIDFMPINENKAKEFLEKWCAENGGSLLN